MVSKVAVIALVAVIAVPILLGYALNLTETTETGYAPEGESVNVTELLQNGTGYSYSKATSYQLNTNFSQNATKIMPDFKTTTNTKTSFKSNIASVSGSNIIYTGARLSEFNLLSYEATYKMSDGYITMNYTKTDNTTGSIQYFHSLHYEPNIYGVKITYYTSDTTTALTVITDLKEITSFTKTGSYDGYMYVVYDSIYESKYINIADGYRFKNNSGGCFVDLPSHTKDVLFTVDLDSITDSTYYMTMDTPVGRFDYRLEKTTSGGQVSWLVRDVNNFSRTFSLYYDQSSSNNTYQIYTELNRTSGDSTYDYYTSHTEFRYVGAWPQLYGPANPYLIITDDVDYRVTAGTDQNLNYIRFISMTGNVSPIIRFDDADFRAFAFPVIADQTYSPASFKNRPITTITNITNYGDSITFGGETFTVSKGNITLEGRQIPVNNLTFVSVPNQDNSGWDNKIGNTIISSSTLYPSTITFNGQWSCSVSTQSLQSKTYTHTEWNAGSFAWDGIDQNFLIVGLVSCLGVFVALGIYARKSRSGGIIPLMIVTGCAAAVFFIML